MKSRMRTFLRYGHVPNPDCAVLDIIRSPAFEEQRRRLSAASIEQIHREARAAAEAAFASLIATPGPIVVPLSGGLDSRFVLAMLLQAGRRNDVLAFTYGVPGTWDYEIPKTLAKRLKVEHTSVDLSSLSISIDDLYYAYATGGEWTELPLALINRLWKRAFPDMPGASGYLGDILAGDQLRRPDLTADLAAASDNFNERWLLPFVQRRKGMGVPGLATCELLPGHHVSLTDQLDIIIQHDGYIRRVLAPPELDMHTPLREPAWVSFMLSLPAEYRIGSIFYRQFLPNTFPIEFSFPTKKNKGFPLLFPPGTRDTMLYVQKLIDRSRKHLFGTPIPQRGSSYGDLMRIFEQASDSIPATAERTFHSLRKPPAHSGAAAGRKALTTFSLLLNVHFSKHESTHMIA